MYIVYVGTNKTTTTGDGICDNVTQQRQFKTVAETTRQPIVQQKNSPPAYFRNTILTNFLFYFP